MNVLVVRAGALGDILLLRPTLATLRAAGATITLLAPERPGSSVRGDGPADVQRLVSWDGPEAARLMTGDAAALGRFDVGLCYSRSADLARALETSCGTLIVHDPAPAEGHAADWMARALAPLSLSLIAAEPPPIVPAADDLAMVQAIFERLPEGFLAIHPGSGSPRKNWPAARFAELAARVSPQPWLLSLGPADEREAEALADAPHAVVTRDLPPRRLGALLSRAGLHVGNDSGVTHLAAACGAPTLAIFGPTDPAVWSPHGPRAAFVRAPEGDLMRLEGDTVWEAAVALSPGRGRGTG